MKLKYLEIFKVCVTGLFVLIANFEMLRPLTQQYEEAAIRGVL